VDDRRSGGLDRVNWLSARLGWGKGMGSIFAFGTMWVR